jgi:hypothetical protein
MKRGSALQRDECAGKWSLFRKPDKAECELEKSRGEIRITEDHETSANPNWLGLLQFISGQNAHPIFLLVAHSNIIASASI